MPSMASNESVQHLVNEVKEGKEGGRGKKEQGWGEEREIKMDKQVHK